MAREIPLTQGQFAIVDDEDFEHLNQFKWFAHWSAKRKKFEAWRYVKTIPNGSRKGRPVNYTMHRELLGVREGFEVDHINRNPLDNRRSNLRWAAKWENCVNRLYSNKHGVRGVFRNGNGFTVRIAVRGLRQTVGTFKTLEDAEEGYRKAAAELHGQFACNEVRKGMTFVGETLQEKMEVM